ncbi:hypothetical protein [Rhizobium laguerreae]|uniref:Uncharacterized protein n=1 Tax=Rhizobium laguerreae TaxID=1076926 RepID=A0A6N9Z8J9_9HYPH|nr:hypothetical protein [Rhizobium laguerreae]NEH89767.1 hypothetical protein [Rhizobium laguerreae]
MPKIITGGAVTSTRELQKYLQIRAPDGDISNEFDKLEHSPVSLNLSRWREVSLDFINKDTFPAKTQVESLRQLLETTWQSVESDRAEWKKYITLLSSLTPVYKIKSVEAKNTTATEKIISGVSLIDPIRNKRYLVTMPAAMDLFHDDDGVYIESRYNDAWSKIAIIQEVHSSDEAATLENEEYLDLSAHAIIRQFAELDVYNSFSTAMEAKTDDFLKAMKLEELDAEANQSLLVNYIAMRMHKKEIDFAMNRLQDGAEKLGYLIATKQLKDIPKGSLYRKTKKTVRYTRTYGNQITGYFTVTYTQKKTVNELIDIDYDIVNRKCEELEASGLTPVVFNLTDEGYETEFGETLSELIDRCDRDPTLRDRSVFLMPDYTTTLAGALSVKGYTLHRSPVKGIARLAFPRIFLEEHFTLRIHWVGTELGPLLHSINLAPGEARKVVVTITTNREEERRQTSSVSAELSDTRSTDLVSEIERETRMESERTTNLAINAKASGNFGAVSGGVSGQYSSKTSVENFGRNLQKTTQKLAASISRRTKQEVSATVSTKVTSGSIETVTSEFRNINDGRTLNLSFYQLNNLFCSRLSLSDIRVCCFPGVETLAGSGSMAGLRGSLAGGLKRSVEEINLSVQKSSPRSWRSNSARERVAKIESLTENLNKDIVLQVLDALAAEYRTHVTNPEVIDGLVALITADDFVLDDDGWKEIDARLVKLVADDHKAVGRDIRVILPSKAVYLDGVLGHGETVEKYSQDMRESVLDGKAADRDYRQAEAELIRARAENLGSRPMIVDAIAAADKKSLAVVLSSPLPGGRTWWFCYDNGIPVQLETVYGGRCLIQIDWTVEQTWMSKPEIAKMEIAENLASPR